MNFAARLRAIEKRMPRPVLVVTIEPGENPVRRVVEEVVFENMENRKPIIFGLFCTSRRGDEVFDKSRAWCARFDTLGRRLK